MHELELITASLLDESQSTSRHLHQRQLVWYKNCLTITKQQKPHNCNVTIIGWSNGLKIPKTMEAKGPSKKPSSMTWEAQWSIYEPGESGDSWWKRYLSLQPVD